ncbi:MAG: hypothetical protein DRJ01_19355, partial [Bacteroidetes bacterium]
YFYINYKFEHSQLFYNKYFTEFDADNIENSVWVTIIPKNIKLFLKYSYKISNAQGKEAYYNLDEIQIFKDTSYEANIYSFNFLIPIKMKTLSHQIFFTTSIKIEQRYFQSNEINDNYHLNRQDDRISLNLKTKYQIYKKTYLKLFYNYTKRNTDSPFDYVEKDKTYSLYQTGLSILLKI